MRNDDAPARDSRRDLGQALSDVLIGEAVEAVAAHALGVELLRQRVMIGNRRVTAVKGGVETRNLRQVGRAREQRPDRRQIVGLMQRSERNIFLEVLEHSGVDEDRPVVGGPPCTTRCPTATGMMS